GRELLQRDVPYGMLRSAARLPTAALDAALCTSARADCGRAELIALAVRDRRDHERTVPLLLDLWDECAARHGDPEPEARALRWFSRLGAAAARPLARELATSANAVRRQRCLLALSALRAPEAAPALLAQAKGPRREEGLLAAYALYRCHALPHATHE